MRIKPGLTFLKKEKENLRYQRTLYNTGTMKNQETRVAFASKNGYNIQHKEWTEYYCIREDVGFVTQIWRKAEGRGNISGLLPNSSILHTI